jgi:histidine ammonia-lyase
MEQQPAGAVTIGEAPLAVDQIVEVACGRLAVRLSQAPAFLERMRKSEAILEGHLGKGTAIYGVTTGFGGSCGNRLHPDQTRILGENLIKYHGCGAGLPLGLAETRATMLCRMLCIAGGYSGVSWGMLEQLAAFLNRGITPVVPQQGSVGASGDLTPMSYIGAAMAGCRDVFYRGERLPAARALELAGLKPYVFKPKEPLAIMNGTSVMTGVAALAVGRARHLLEALSVASALCVHALAGHVRHFHPALFQAKPFPGQAAVAERLRGLLSSSGNPPEATDPDSLQDPYSLRCSPHVLGVLADALEWVARWVEIEANGVSDNPLLDPESGEVLTGGNFYGGHMAFAMDSLKAALASCADMSDRQIALLVDRRFNRGLPSCLKGTNGEKTELHHGFKGAQITASALTAEALKGTMPAASFSRSTESHNQDKVSMGTIAARDALAICDLAANVGAIHLLAAAQACELRGGLETRPALAAWVQTIRTLAGPVKEDRPLDADIAATAAAILEGLRPRACCE